MNDFHEQINIFCPDGVEFKKLGDCCVILDNKRKPVTRSYRTTGEYPYYEANGIQDYVSDYIFDGAFVLVGEDGSVITKKGAPVVNWAEGKIWVNNHAHIIKEVDGVLLRYLFHCIQTIDIRKLIHGAIPKLTQSDFKNLMIPLPPLEVQRKIAHILDKFTELTRELALRKKQYSYYRDKLLTDAKAIYSVKLEDVAEYSTIKINANEVNAKNYVGVDNLLQNRAGKTESKYVPEQGRLTGFKASDILIGNIHPYLRKIWFADCEGGTNGDVLVITVTDSEKVFPKFLYYILSSEDFFFYVAQHSKCGKMPRGDKKKIIKYQFTLTPIDEQRRISAILDKFDSLCSDITSGIPAEITARRKQYEYYRDKLLTFRRKN